MKANKDGAGPIVSEIIKWRNKVWWLNDVVNTQMTELIMNVFSFLSCDSRVPGTGVVLVRSF